MMRALIAYYDPLRRPAAEERPDFTALQLTGMPSPRRASWSASSHCARRPR